MKVHDLHPAPGSTRGKRRVGRGIAGKGGKTAGRGTKGQKARSKVAVGFEGGQLPLMQRIPKLRGFNNPFRVEYVAINVGDLADIGTTEITPAALRERGLIPKKGLLKILGNGELTTTLTVSAHAFSASAERAITGAGGSVSLLPKPWAVRPPAAGNHLMNR
ncbi:MAG: 50S ribosomal protein L15 [Acidimicrobiales bacterium]